MDRGITCVETFDYEVAEAVKAQSCVPEQWNPGILWWKLISRMVPRRLPNCVNLY